MVALTPSPILQTAEETKTSAELGVKVVVISMAELTGMVPLAGDRVKGAGTVQSKGAGTSPVLVIMKVLDVVTLIGHRPRSMPAGVAAWRVGMNARMGTWNPPLFAPSCIWKYMVSL